MRTIVVTGNETIRIGRVGENRAVQIIWPGLLEKWRELYGDGTVQLAARRPKDTAPYPVVCEIRENDVTWTVQAADTARHGIGECELTYFVGEKVAKSQTWATEILRSLTEDETVEPPEDPARAWFTAIREQIGNLDELTTEAKDNLVAAINEAAQSGGGVQSDWNQNDATQPDYLKNKPFYLEKTLVIKLTKDNFTVNNQNGYFDYMYRSTPKLDWFTSAESIAFEIEIVDTNGRRYTATQDSIDVDFENDTTDDGYEYWACYSNLFDIVSGVDLDYYDDEYYYKDEWGVLVKNGGTELSVINIKIYRVDVKKIPEICVDAAIGQTAITVGGTLENSETEIEPSVIVPNLRIPISPSVDVSEIYYDRIFGLLRTSGDLFPYRGRINYTFQQVMPTTAGSSISFDISSEGDTLWDTLGWNSPWKNGHFLYFTLRSYHLGGERIEFLSSGPSVFNLIGVVAASNLGHLYTVVFEYTNSHKTLNVTLKCVVE